MRYICVMVAKQPRAAPPSVRAEVAKFALAGLAALLALAVILPALVATFLTGLWLLRSLGTAASTR